MAAPAVAFILGAGTGAAVAATATAFVMFVGYVGAAIGESIYDHVLAPMGEAIADAGAAVADYVGEIVPQVVDGIGTVLNAIAYGGNLESEEVVPETWPMEYFRGGGYYAPTSGSWPLVIPNEIDIPAPDGGQITVTESPKKYAAVFDKKGGVISNTVKIYEVTEIKTINHNDVKIAKVVVTPDPPPSDPTSVESSKKSDKSSYESKDKNKKSYDKDSDHESSYSEGKKGSDKPDKSHTSSKDGGGKKAKPILLDLDGDGDIDLTPFAVSQARFDIDTDGFDEQLTWIGVDEDTGQVEDGFLVVDLNLDGNISAEELALAQLTDDPTDTDLEVFAAMFDTNEDGGDGVVDSRDADWSKIKVWRDADADGTVDDGELLDPASIGLTSIDVSKDDGNWVLVDDMTDAELARFGVTRDDVGVVGKCGDIILNSGAASISSEADGQC